MQHTMQLPQTWEEYQKIYENECLFNDGQIVTIRPEIQEEINRIAQDWIGFDSFLDQLLAGVINDEEFYQDILRESGRAHETEREHRALEIAASRLGWLGVQVVYLYSYLDFLKRRQGHGYALEYLASFRGHYLGLLEDFNQKEEKNILTFNQQHPALYEFLSNLFFDLLINSLQDENKYHCFLNAIEGGDGLNSTTTIRESLIEPLKDDVKGMVWIVLALTNRFDYSELVVEG